MSKVKYIIEVDEDDINDFIERGIVRAEVARNAKLMYESDDCVSRQSVIDIVKKEWHPIEVIKSMPPVTPKREQGKWCEQNDDYFDWYECSECGYGSEGEMQYSSEHDVRTKYCPNCGAEMR